MVIRLRRPLRGLLPAAVLASVAMGASAAPEASAFNSAWQCVGVPHAATCGQGSYHSWIYTSASTTTYMGFMCAGGFTEAGNEKASRNPPYSSCAANENAKISCLLATPTSNAYGEWLDNYYHSIGAMFTISGYADTNAISPC